MKIPRFFRDFLSRLSNRQRGEIKDWLESNSATVIVDDLRKYIE